MSYAPADEPGFRLFTAPAYFDASSSEWTMDVFRLRPSTLYTAEVVGELTEVRAGSGWRTGEPSRPPCRARCDAPGVRRSARRQISDPT